MVENVREIEIELFPGCTVKVPQTDFSQRESDALRIPEDMLPSEWAERYRILQEDEAALAGPWSNANAPYLVGIMDMSIKQGVRYVSLKKGVQGGISDAIRNVMGYWAMMDPSPVGLVLPNKEKGEQIVRNKRFSDSRHQAFHQRGKYVSPTTF